MQAARSSVSKMAPIGSVRVSAYTIPTDSPESDGTLEWKKTTIVVVETSAADTTGLGFTYADKATAEFIKEHLADLVQGRDAMDTPGCWRSMVHAIRNLGRPGASSMAISAVDLSLWDLKAKLLGLPLAKLLGMVREGAPVYGSGGFTSYSDKQLAEQLGNWTAAGIPRVKMKVGRRPADDLDRVRIARRAIGDNTELFVDANGAYSRKAALAFADRFSECRVTWFEEPVTSADLKGLRLVRDRTPSGMEIAAGEYGYDLPYFRRMLEAESVDVLQADASRCAGVTGFLEVCALSDAYLTPLSAHTAPSLHLHLGCAVKSLRHLEYFHDHVRIENMLFDGVIKPRAGILYPDLTRPGLGLEFRRSDAERYAA